MDLNTIESIVRPARRAELPEWRVDSALLAGGTWLFSEPQPHLKRLIDLTDFKWPSLVINEHGLEIAATCTIAELDEFVAPHEWFASVLFGQCCRAFLASFKIWKAATVGGNLCLSLPAGPMISLTSALDGVCTIWTPHGERQVSAMDFVTGNGTNVLARGEVLRKIDISKAALRQRSAFRQVSLTPAGRSAALLIGLLGADDRNFSLTITASTVRPIKLTFPRVPDAPALREALEVVLPANVIHDDVHGKPAWRRHMTFRLAEDIRQELLQSR